MSTPLLTEIQSVPALRAVGLRFLGRFGKAKQDCGPGKKHFEDPQKRVLLSLDSLVGVDNLNKQGHIYLYIWICVYVYIYMCFSNWRCIIRHRNQDNAFSKKSGL